MSSTIGPKLNIVDFISDGATYGDIGRAFLRMFQALIQANVINLITSTPPGSPMNGDTYVVDTPGSGAWVGKDTYIAYWTTDDPNTPSGKWEFFQPLTGWIVGNQADQTAYIFDGAAWTAIGGGGGSGALIYGTDSSPQLLAVQKIQTGSASLSTGTKAVTILAAVYSASYAWSAVATSQTTNGVRATISGDTVTFTGTGTDAFNYIIFPIFALS